MAGFMAVERILNGKLAPEAAAFFTKVVLRSNARLRAWATKVPVDGLWAWWDGVLPELVMGCKVCGGFYEAGLGAANRGELFGPHTLDAQAAEREVVHDMIRSGCDHLAPMLRPDPEVEAVIALELLAGEPPR